MSSRRRGLRVVGGRGAAPQPQPGKNRPRRPRSRLRQLLEALLLMAGGVGLLVLLLLLPELIDLDSLLLISTALGHLIGGLQQLLLGILQLLAVLLLVALALLALLLLVGGLVRFVRALLARAPARSAVVRKAPVRR